MSKLAWWERAACAGLDTEIFYPDDPAHVSSRSPLTQLELDAVTICRACPVSSECLTDALTVQPDEDYGIRGGFTRRHRMVIRRRRGLPIRGRVASPIKELRRRGAAA